MLMPLERVGRRAIAMVPYARALRSAAREVRSRIRFKNDFEKYSHLAVNRNLIVPRWEDRFPCLTDNTATTEFARHYIYHTGWAARVLAETKPKLHVDISSSLYFVSILSAFVPVEHYDYRPPDLYLDNLHVKRGDLMALPFESSSVESLSCMHVIEHVGLGRYGDPLDPEGDIKAARELSRVLAPNGSFLFVTPVGKARVCFNAHRIYSYEQVLQLFPELELRDFRLLPDVSPEGLIPAEPAIVSQQEYGCGCFRFVKRA